MPKFFPKIDWILFFAMFLLSLLGLLMVYSTTVGDVSQENFLLREGIYIIVGLVAFWVVANINFRLLVNLSPWFYLAVVILLVVTALIGTETRGSTRWIDLGLFTLQASEIAKPVLILTLVWFFNRYPPINIRNFFVSFLIIALPTFLVYQQPDLGSSLVLFLIWISLVYLSGLKLIYLIIMGAAGFLILPLFINFLAPYQRDRLVSFLNPATDPLGSNYNLVQSIIAVGSGQFFGRGFGRGTQSHLNFLPEQKTDFIFATTAEELGFFGVCVILILFGVLLYRIHLIAERSREKSASLLCYGALLIILAQLFINSGMNMGILPVTGITLPFISFGGSSLISMMILVGLVASVAADKSKKS